AERLRPVTALRPKPAGDEPPPRPSGLTRRRVLIAAVALAVVAAGIAIPLSLGGGSSEPPSVATRPNSVARVDLGNGGVVADTPPGIVARDDGVWVSGPSTGTVVRIDPGSKTVAGTTNVGNGPDAVQSDASGIWVANTLDGTVTRIDPRSGAVDATVQVGDGP